MLNQPSPSCQTQQNNVYERLQTFTEYFVKEFETKLQLYHGVLEGKELKELLNTLSQQTWREIGAATGFVLGGLIPAPYICARVGGALGGDCSKAFQDRKLQERCERKAAILADLVHEYHRNKAEVRSLLVEAGIDIFQSFETQFMKVTADQGYPVAMRKLAEDAVNRALNFYVKEGKALIPEAVISDKSRIEPILGVRKSPGFKIKFEDGGVVYTGSLYDKAGVVVERNGTNTYYERKTGTVSRPEKYGYRRLLMSESWENLGEKYKRSDTTKSIQFTDYPYVLTPKDLQKYGKIILDQIDSDDKNLGEQRIKRMLEEIKADLLECLAQLRKKAYPKNAAGIRSIQESLSSLDIDEHYQKFNMENPVPVCEIVEESVPVDFKGQFESLSTKLEEMYLVVTSRRASQENEGIWFNVRKPVTFFTGREEQLSVLHKALQSDGKAIVSQSVSISGLGGIGKSELARKYISKHSQDYDNKILWMNAESYSTLSDSFRRLASDRLGISTKNIDGKEKDIKSIVEDVYKFFSKGKSLFIFDNAEKFKDGIFEFLPNLPNNMSKPHILVTSRNKEWPQVKLLELDVFTPEEATEFIKEALEIEDDAQEQEIEKLAKTLQCFPLALQQAVAYIMEENKKLKRRGKGEYTIGNYLKDYKEKANELLKSEAFKNLDSDYDRTTFTTWEVTTNKIKDDEKHGQLALEILNIMSYLAPNNIPIEEVFLKLETDEKRLWEAIELLNRYSMIKLENGISDIHRLVQQVTRLDLKDQDKEEEVLQEALDLFENGLTTSNINHAVSVWKYASKYDELVRESSSLPCMIINKLINDIRYEEAYSFGKQAYELLSSKLGPDHANTLTTLNNIATTLDKQGKYDEALQLYQQVHEIQKRTLDPNDPDTLTTLNNIALMLDNQGKYDEALQYYEEVYDKRKNILGPDHQDTLTTLNDMALVLDNQGKYYEALEIYQKVHEKRTNILGYDHPEILITHNNMAAVFFSLGIYNKALRIYQDVYKRQKELDVLGPDHPNTLNTLHNIAAVLSKKGQYAEALKNYQEVYPKREKVLGPDHPDTLTTLHNMAGVFYKQGQYAEALKKYQQVYDTQKRTDILGPNHPDTLTTLNKLANVLNDQAKYGEAIEKFNQAYDIQERVLGPDHPETLTTLNDLVGVLFKQGKYDEALQHYQEVYCKREKALSHDHPDTLTTLNNIANVFSQQGKYDEALQLYQLVYDKRTDILGPDHPDTLTAWGNMAGILYKQGKYDEALQEYKQVYETFKKTDILGPNHPDTLTAWGNMAVVLSAQGKYDEALKIYEEVNAVQVNVLGPDHPKTLTTEEATETLKRSRKVQLHYAVHAGNKDAIVNLLNKGADITQVTDKGSTSLHIAADQGRSEIVCVLLKYAKQLSPVDLHNFINASTITGGTTALHIAAQKGNLEIVKLLLQSGAIYNIKNKEDKAPLELADSDEIKELFSLVDKLFKSVKKGDNKQVAQLLKKEEAIINSRDDNGATPLYWSINKGHTQVVRILLGNGANPTSVTNKGNTTLHLASARGNNEIVVALLDKVKNNDPKNLNNFINTQTTAGGTSALHIASNVEVAKSLLKYGAIYNIKNKEGKTPFDSAKNDDIRNLLNLTHELFEDAKNGNDEIIDKLRSLEREESEQFIAVTNARNEQGHTLFEVAITNGHENIVSELSEIMSVPMPKLEEANIEPVAGPSRRRSG